MGLFTAIWMKEKLSVQQQEKAKRKVMKLKDKKLIQAATEAPVGAIRAAAVQRLTDREALWEIALKDGDGYVRYAALRQLAMKGDQGALEKLCGLLIDPFTAEAAVTILREVYAETRTEIIRATT